MSLTSTEAPDTLSTAVLPPSSSPESTGSHGHLRRRMHVLESSNSSPLIKQKPDFMPNHKDRREELTEGNLDVHSRELLDKFPAHDLSFESNSALSSALDIPATGNPRVVDPSRPTSYPSESAPRSARAWYEFDLSVMVALASPIGKWLTGGDHVRNFLLILLLIFYLHQIIEIPWTLYHNSRPRRRIGSQNGPKEPHEVTASTELRAIEFFFLILTVASPFIGAVFLRLVISAVSGTDALSWFSTGLFILATGMRPWRHLIDRFQQRTTELHNIIHYPPVPNKLESELHEMTIRVVQLEKSLATLRTKFADLTEDVYGYVDDAVDFVQTSGKKQEKKLEKAEKKLKEIEESIVGLKKGKEKDKRLSVNTNISADSAMALVSFFPSWLGFGLLSSSHTPQRSRHPLQPSVSKHTIRSYPSTSSTRLASIPEEENTKPPPAETRSFRLHIPGLHLVLRWGDLATLPLRRVVSYLLT